jgi:ubiquinone/menaquinone biosynthesis C-methylase UbiE
MFEDGAAYNRQMGRWSRQLAPLFIDYIGIRPGDRVLDVGCGTGSLAMTVAATTQAEEVVGLDYSEGFINFARAHNSFSQLRYDLGDACALPYADIAFDRCLTLLAVNHIPDAPKAAREMARVAKPGAVLGAAMWDGTGGNEFNDIMWTVAESLDSTVRRPSEKRNSYSSPEAMTRLWQQAGLESMEIKALSMECRFENFAELWGRYAEGQGPGGHYVRALTSSARDALREKLRATVLGGKPDVPFALQAKAWAVRGVVTA